MPALQRRREKWEIENRQRLEKVIDVSQVQIQKQFYRSGQIASFLLFLIYTGGIWLFRIFQAPWVYSQDELPRLRAAEQQRLKLGTHTSNSLK
jgi:hypothetical protein